jgi:hypothetical protein
VPASIAKNVFVGPFGETPVTAELTVKVSVVFALPMLLVARNVTFPDTAALGVPDNNPPDVSVRFADVSVLLPAVTDHVIG